MKKESVRVSTSVNSQYPKAEGGGGQISTAKYKDNGQAAPRKKIKIQTGYYSLSNIVNIIYQFQFTFGSHT